MTPEFWRGCAEKPKIKGEYILLYSVYINKNFDDYAKKLSKKTGLPLVRICPDIHQVIKRGKSVVIPPVFDFITLIDNAKYVLTDSFHATAFSMMLNTEPICVLHNNPERISSFLRLVGAEHCIVKDADDLGVIDHPVDFENAEKILARERERVDEFLRGIFNTNESTS